MGQTVLCMYNNHITPDLLIFIVNGRHSYCLNQTSLCIQSNRHARCYILYQNVICILPQKNWLCFPVRNI